VIRWENDDGDCINHSIGIHTATCLKQYETVLLIPVEKNSKSCIAISSGGITYLGMKLHSKVFTYMYVVLCQRMKLGVNFMPGYKSTHTGVKISA
jgi:hypothetical protein